MCLYSEALARLILLAIHSLADKQIGVHGISANGICGSGIRRIGQLDSLSRGTEHHIRGIYPAAILHSLPRLEPAPDISAESPVLSPAPRQIFLPGLSPWYTRSRPHCDLPGNAFSRYPFSSNVCLRSLDLMKQNGKRKLRGDHAQGIDHPLQSFRTDQSQRLRAVSISHGQKQARKPADMVAVDNA